MEDLKELVIANCPIRNVLSRICDKWSMLILFMLHRMGKTPMRFSELKKSIPDISQKMLTSTLRTLETDGFVCRKVYAEVPPRVEYSLTSRAESVIPLVNALISWAADNMSAITKDRERNAGVQVSKRIEA